MRDSRLTVQRVSRCKMNNRIALVMNNRIVYLVTLHGPLASCRRRRATHLDHRPKSRLLCGGNGAMSVVKAMISNRWKTKGGGLTQPSVTPAPGAPPGASKRRCFPASSGGSYRSVLSLSYFVAWFNSRTQPLPARSKKSSQTCCCKSWLWLWSCWRWHWNGTVMEA